MADVLLVYPKAGHDLRKVSVTAPLSLLAVAAPLTKDFSVQIIDQRTTDTFWEDLEAALKTNPLLVGLSSMTGTQIYHSLEISKFVKAHSSTPVLWGGMHCTIHGAQTIAKPNIDFVIRGEGELAIRKLVETLSKKSENFDTVPSLMWKKFGRLYSTPAAEPLDLNQLPRTPWHLVDIEEYVAPSQYAYPGISRLLPVQGSRGCPFKCTFCSEPALTKKYRAMTPDRIIEECMEMVRQFNLDHIVFYDEEFFVNKVWATKVAQAINGRFSWWTQTRAADLLKVDLKLMEKCGLMIVAPGLESGSDRILKFVRKGETVEEYREAHRRLSETTIKTQYNFIIGFPTETKKEMTETVDLILYLLKGNPHATINQLSPLTPLPGTELLRQAMRDFHFEEPTRLEDWIQITRGKQERSWLDKKQLRLVRFLYYSSLFLCTVRHADRFKIPKFVWNTYSQFTRFRWKHKLFWLDWEVPIIRLLFRWMVNPIDYTLPKNYGDSFTAKESDVITVPQTPTTPQKKQEPEIPLAA